MRKHNQYYTERHLGEQLVQSLGNLSSINSCVELGVGRGALIAPLCERVNLSALLTCDIDEKNCENSRSCWPSGFHYNSDVLSENFEQIVKQHKSNFDLALCNPPFSWVDQTDYTRKVLNKFGFSRLSKGKSLRMEIFFILQNIRLLKLGGSFGLIVPELIVKSSQFADVRIRLDEIFEFSYLKENDQFPFKGTEAKTYLLVLRNKVKRLIDRDVFKEDNVILRNEKKSELPVEIKRGKLTGKECRNSSITTFHTSDFKRLWRENDLQGENKNVTPLAENIFGTIATRGDLVVARVGTRVVGEIAFIEEGDFVLSDCVFRLRFSSPVTAVKFYDFWLKNKAEIIDRYSSGTCAKHLTKTCLYEVVDWFFSVFFLKKSQKMK